MSNWIFGGASEPKTDPYKKVAKVPPSKTIPVPKYYIDTPNGIAVKFPGGIPREPTTTNDNWRGPLGTYNILGTPTSPSSGGGYSQSGGGGGKSVPAPKPTWSTTYTSPYAPSWWLGKTPSIMDDKSKYAALLNALIPYLSPEDQRTYASNLYRNYAEAFPEYDPELMQYPIPPGEVTTEIKQRFTEKERAEQALATLSQVAGITGQTDEKMGTGYKFLRNLLSVLKDFGGESAENQQTRQQYLQQMGALDPLLAEGKSSELSPYSSIAQSLASPYFTAGQAVPIQKTSDGRYIFGQANRQLF